MREQVRVSLNQNRWIVVVPFREKVSDGLLQCSIAAHFGQDRNADALHERNGPLGILWPDWVETLEECGHFAKSLVDLPDAGNHELVVCLVALD